MITLTREEAQQVLDALEELNRLSIGKDAICLPAEIDDAMEILEAQLSAPEPSVSYTGNGTAGRENMTAPTGFFFQMPKPEPEPVAWIYEDDEGRMMFSQMPQTPPLWEPVYKARPQREWQGLTNEEREEATGWSVEHIEAKLKEKNS